MENKLYYQDAYLKLFKTELINQQKDEQGRVYAVLQETAFYPTGGGQPHDTGALNGVKVMDVEEVDGEIRHYLEHTLELSSQITGEINWGRRFDHMQQHAGQHILSAAFEECFGFSTVGFHLGSDYLTIDLNIEELTEEQANEAEHVANQMILENRAIETKWATTDELSSYPLRKELSVTDNIRLVIIPEFDYNGCGGTHPRSTGEVRAIKILDWEKQRKKVRIQFICGERVLMQLHQKQREIKKLTKILNAPEHNLANTAQKLLDGRKELEKQMEEMQGSLLEYEAKKLLSDGRSLDAYLVVAEIFQNRNIQQLQKLARSITSLSTDVIVFLVNEEEERLQFVCARGSNPTMSMKELTSELLSAINGKGGGSDTFTQGGGERLLTAGQFLSKGIEWIER
ncbi:alanyl-tRNA synthetase [Cytobacillus eiseniae]|uniref:Alanyl-tRNA synthetase n=1 Tax=Cytobacillus eiseniae TaxID=762947 RepID=A0ABS4RHR4_9BACI|nr:alanyl-tRNA synthetase [Cytobacillus eiseniae]